MGNLSVPGGGARNNFILWWLQQQAKDKGPNPRAVAGMSQVDWENMHKYEQARLATQDQMRANAYQNEDFLRTQDTAREMARISHLNDESKSLEKFRDDSTYDMYARMNPDVVRAKELTVEYYDQEAEDLRTAREAATGRVDEDEAADTADGVAPKTPPDRSKRPSFLHAADVVVSAKTTADATLGTSSGAVFITRNPRQAPTQPRTRRKSGKKSTAEDVVNPVEETQDETSGVNEEAAPEAAPEATVPPKNKKRKKNNTPPPAANESTESEPTDSGDDDGAYWDKFR